MRPRLEQSGRVLRVSGGSSADHRAVVDALAFVSESRGPAGYESKRITPFEYGHDGALYCGAGYRDRLYDLLAARGSHPEVVHDTRHAGPQYDIDPTPLQGFEPREGQLEALFDILGRDSGIVLAPTGWGKAQPLSALVYTPRGPRLMGRLRVGDKICDPHGGTQRVVAIHPQGEIPVYRVRFDDGAVVECCGDHLWEVSCPRLWGSKSAPRVVSTDFIRGLLGKPWVGLGVVVKATKPLDFQPNRKLPIDPYTLGAFLGDGHLSTGGTPHLTSADDEVVDAVSSQLDGEYCLRQGPGTITYSLRRKVRRSRAQNRYQASFTELGLAGSRSWNKFIPPEYQLASTPDRWSLLRGLMDTDGYVEKCGRVQFTTTSRRLASGVRVLVESLGIVAVSERSKQPKKGRLAYTLTFAAEDPAEMFALTRKRVRCRKRTKYQPVRRITSIEFVGNKLAQCITVSNPDGLYVTNHAVVTHNSHLIQIICRVLPKARIDYLTYSADVCSQMYEDLAKAMPAVGRIGAGKNRKARVNVVNVDSAHKADYDADLILGDEIHQLAADRMYDQLCRYGQGRPCRAYGLTASLKRMDNMHRRLEGVFGPVVREIHYQQAVRADMIVPIHVDWRRPVVPLDPGAGMPSGTERERVGFWQNWARNDEVAAAANSIPDGEQRLIVVKSTEHAYALKSRLPDYEVCYAPADHANGLLDRFKAVGLIRADEPPMTEARRRRLRHDFAEGVLRKAISTWVWATGVNFKQLSYAVRADGTASDTNIRQFAGRLSRLYPGKTKATLIDFWDSWSAYGVARSRTRKEVYADLGFIQSGPPPAVRASFSKNR